MAGIPSASQSAAAIVDVMHSVVQGDLPRGSGDAAYESHNHPIDNDETWTDTLKPGTLVLLIPIYGQNEQLYWLADSGVKL